MFEIVRFSRSYDRTTFSCGKPALDTWLHQNAGQNEDLSSARTFLAVIPEQVTVVGYYTLVSASVQRDHSAQMVGVGTGKYPIPVILLARLAVSTDHQGNGLGSELLADALQRAAGVASEVGVQAVIVDAIDDDAVTFYGRNGFSRFSDAQYKMFLPMKTLLASI